MRNLHLPTDTEIQAAIPQVRGHRVTPFWYIESFDTVRIASHCKSLIPLSSIIHGGQQIQGVTIEEAGLHPNYGDHDRVPNPYRRVEEVDHG